MSRFVVTDNFILAVICSRPSPNQLFHLKLPKERGGAENLQATLLMAEIRQQKVAL